MRHHMKMFDDNDNGNNDDVPLEFVRISHINDENVMKNIGIGYCSNRVYVLSMVHIFSSMKNTAPQAGKDTVCIT